MIIGGHESIVYEKSWISSSMAYIRAMCKEIFININISIAKYETVEDNSIDVNPGKLRCWKLIERLRNKWKDQIENGVLKWNSIWVEQNKYWREVNKKSRFLISCSVKKVYLGLFHTKIIIQEIKQTINISVALLRSILV